MNRLAICMLIMTLRTLDIPCQGAEQLTSAPPGTFSIVVIPDTQAYKGGGIGKSTDRNEPITNPIFQAHTSWIVKNLDRQKIAFVSHVGDIVDVNEPGQWKIARQCMDQIHGKVPYGISVGNHDMTSRGDSSLFQQYFPSERFSEFPWYGGCYTGSEAAPHLSGNNANSYQFFTACGIDFLFLHLECNAPDDVITWANETIQQHPDRRVFITTHMGWGPRFRPKSSEGFISAPKGRMEWSKIHGTRGNSPQQLWEKCYRHHPHLIAVFSGDQSRTQAYQATTLGDHGNHIHELLQDYSSGWLRLYRFFPDENRVDAITFHPSSEELCEGVKLVPDRNQHQFSLKVSLKEPLRKSQANPLP